MAMILGNATLVHSGSSKPTDVSSGAEGIYTAQAVGGSVTIQGSNVSMDGPWVTIVTLADGESYVWQASWRFMNVTGAGQAWISRGDS